MSAKVVYQTVKFVTGTAVGISIVKSCETDSSSNDTNSSSSDKNYDNYDKVKSEESSGSYRC